MDRIGAAEVAQRAADAVRLLVDAGSDEPGAPALTFPTDVYLALGFLTRLTADASPALSTLSTWLQAETVAGRVVELPDGARHGDPAAAVGDAASRLDDACDLLRKATDAMTDAHTLLRGVSSA